MSAAAGRVFLLGASGWLGSAIAQAVPGTITLAAVDDLHRAEASELDTVINAAGSKDPATMRLANTVLVEQLIEATQRGGARLVHLGSAAEYGIPEHARRLSEQEPEHPSSQYGLTKLAATQLLRDCGRACVLRLFNIADNPPQVGSPLEDVLQKVRAAAREGGSPSLFAAGTVRDWVTRDFVAASVAAAVERAPVGVFNVCSGVGVSMADLASALLRRFGLATPVHDLQLVPAGTVIGDPSAWEHASGLAQRLTAEALAVLLIPQPEVLA